MRDVQWHPFIEEYLGLLYDKEFLLFNIIKDLDNPEVTIPLPS